MAESNEQWLLNGNCNKCRRQKYCSKGCKRNKISTQRAINRFITDKMDERTGGAYSQIMSHLYRK